MNSRMAATAVRIAATTSVALILSACAALAPASKEETVRERAAARAAAFAKGDYARAYEYLSPSYRKARDVDAYRRSLGAGATWQKAEVATVACEEQRCKVGVKVSVKPLIPAMNNATITVQFEETWLLEDGNWWLHQAL